MGAVKDTYEIIKDLLSEAKKLKNYDFVEKVLEIQQRFFDLNQENQGLKSEVKEKESLIEEFLNIKQQYADLKSQNDKLEEKVTMLDKVNDLSFLDNEIDAHYSEIRYVFTTGMAPSVKNNIEEKIKDIYYYVATKLLVPIEDSKFSDLFNKSVKGTFSYLDSSIVGQLKAKFLEHKLIEIIERPKEQTKIKLTEFGQRVLNKINEL